MMDFNQSAARKPRFIDIVVSHAAPRYVLVTIALNAPSLSNSVEQVLQLIPAASIFTCRRYYCHRMAAPTIAEVEAPVVGARTVMQAGCGVAGAYPHQVYKYAIIILHFSPSFCAVTYLTILPMTSGGYTKLQDVPEESAKDAL